MSNNEMYYEIDRGIYNDIIKGYCLIAANRVLKLNRKQTQALMGEFRNIFDTIGAWDAEQYYYDNH